MSITESLRMSHVTTSFAS